MILIATKTGIDERISSDPRFSTAQVAAIIKAARVDPLAAVIGLDAKMRPVVKARLTGPGRRVVYALMRNGEPTKITKPYAETWGGERS